jgi:hypothetical protein
MSANRAYFRQFGGSAASAIDQSIFGLEHGQWNCPELHDLLENVLPRDQHFEGRVIEHEFGNLGALRLSLNAHRVVMPAQSGEMMMLVFNVLPPEPAVP